MNRQIKRFRGGSNQKIPWMDESKDPKDGQTKGSHRWTNEKIP